MKIIVLAVAAATLAFPAVASAREFCGKLDNHYGPFDYRTEKGRLPIVDGAHFTEEVEAGIRGATDELGGDLDYTLRAFPNHHRALATLSRVALRDKVVMIPKTKWPVECYFLRAQRLAPNDAVVYNLYGAYLSSKGKHGEALVQYKEAIRFDPDNAMFNYNIGLAYLKKNDFDKALYHAHRAYEQQYPLPGLKNQLLKAGKWNDKPAAEKPSENKIVEAKPPG